MKNIRNINLPFCGFYESSASHMIDDEIEQAFDYSDGGGHSHIPEEIYWDKKYGYDLLERWVGNGGLSNAVWEAMPAELADFANLQRDYGKAVDFALWIETGKCYPDGTTEEQIAAMEPLPEPRC